ncbi:1-aminocyclopropane-1-carboxylate deaminase/D-cysteine desulfhydrase [Nocardioides pocheonensis]|uniref:1-aminocyclopropane-1-carboxylate deaminase/D-cysteine desulfhydrase n=1 Tax=Nocardioides pocheonensis TaxID=661485 RepID=UPI001FE376CD|nr:pyridoxal-phosphate dependent enzyme [Nocardioides pocheonensis]
MSTLDNLPRVGTVLAPTPLDPAVNLSDALGVEVWFKRDDLTGRGFGGNKVRTVEYLLGHALAEGHDCVVTGAGPQSNWAMLSALTATMAGLEPHLIYYGDPQPAAGNQLLAEISGACIRWTGEVDRTSLDPVLNKVARELIDSGRSPCVIPRGGATPLGCLGYVRGAIELTSQLVEHGIEATSIWLATGSCGTQAGLISGLTVLDADLPVIGVATSRTPTESAERVATLAAGTLALLGDRRNAPEPIVVGGFIGEGYGIPSDAGRWAAELVARTEGVFLDPVFGAKAMAALIEYARRDLIKGPLVYLVTGGAPTVLTK